MTLVLHYVWFAIHSNTRASGVPEMSCDQSQDGHNAPPAKQFYRSRETITVLHKDSSGVSTSKKEQFILLIPTRYLGNYSYLVKATGRATIVTVEYLYSC